MKASKERQAKVSHVHFIQIVKEEALLQKLRHPKEGHFSILS
jgi:hypothetical protein